MGVVRKKYDLEFSKFVKNKFFPSKFVHIVTNLEFAETEVLAGPSPQANWDRKRGPPSSDLSLNGITQR